MFGLGMPEILLILVVALIFIGPKKLPDIAKSLGKAMGEFKKAANDLKESINQPDEPASVRQPHYTNPVDEKPDEIASSAHEPVDTSIKTADAVHDPVRTEHGEKKSDE